MNSTLSTPYRSIWAPNFSGRTEKFGAQMERYGVDNVEFMGFVSQEDKARYYASVDVCCVPSTGNESFGYVIVEPMAAGRPVVATDIPGYASVAVSYTHLRAHETDS